MGTASQQRNKPHEKKLLNHLIHPEIMTMAEIIPFPMDHEIAFIRKTARILTIKRGAAADRFWQITCRRLYARLQLQGVAHHNIRHEINAFALTVFAEAKRQQPNTWGDDSPPAAK